MRIGASIFSLSRVQSLAWSARGNHCTKFVLSFSSSAQGGDSTPKVPPQSRQNGTRGAMHEFLKNVQKTPESSGGGAWGAIIEDSKPVYPSSSLKPSAEYGQTFNSSTAAPGSRNKNRVFNSKMGGPPRRKAPGLPGSVPSQFSGAGDEDGPARPRGMRGDDGLGLESDEEIGTDDEADPAVVPFLYDNEPFEEWTKKGAVMDYSEMDTADKFFADMFMESYKSKTGEVKFVGEPPQFKRVRIPKPRPTRELLETLVPDIDSVDPKTDPESHELASEAWLVIDNFYYFLAFLL